LKKIVIICAHLFPSPLKIFFLRLAGYKIGKNCHIGYSCVFSKEVTLADDIYIGNFNIIKSLTHLNMAKGSRVGTFNWITGAGIGGFSLGRNSSIRRFHFFEASGGVLIGSNSIIAGRSSHFFTHGLSPDNLDLIQPITIGSWCYIGSSVRFVPGVDIPKGSFIGMGSVVTKTFKDEYQLIAGNPAVVKKELNRRSVYFSREYLRHTHHRKEYGGLSND